MSADKQKISRFSRADRGAASSTKTVFLCRGKHWQLKMEFVADLLLQLNVDFMGDLTPSLALLNS